MAPSLLDRVDLSLKLKNKDVYLEKLQALQTKMQLLQIACYHHGHQVVILLEGWDAAGKGGAIRRLVEKMDPRSVQVHPIKEPNDSEAKQHYLQRFWEKLPAKGNISIFDRSWYGRVLVERVEGFAAEAEWQRAYDEINRFEKMLTDSGVVLVKLFLHISQNEQLNRYSERLANPRKNWKFTDEDLRNRQHATLYTQAYEDMFAKTTSPVAPWHIVPAEHKWYARVKVLETVCEEISAGLDTRIPILTEQEIVDAKLKLGLN